MIDPQGYGKAMSASECNTKIQATLPSEGARPNILQHKQRAQARAAAKRTLILQKTLNGNSVAKCGVFRKETPNKTNGARKGRTWTARTPTEQVE